ncbi:MAG: hypothetical protein PHE17_17915 [Thiothrix sp.]|uniref:hypothetical protein n=1 Tax=Thiothrix sp. TaxID=1032 RepID=UPI00260AEEF7|nr:hypothetical protein [Thiothrix sp.]MDD5394897.1 hypothetical protein [Thiothrix sp.]
MIFATTTLKNTALDQRLVDVPTHAVQSRPGIHPFIFGLSHVAISSMLRSVLSRTRYLLTFNRITLMPPLLTTGVKLKNRLSRLLLLHTHRRKV